MMTVEYGIEKAFQSLIEGLIADDATLSADIPHVVVKCSRDPLEEEKPEATSYISVVCGQRANDAFSLNMVAINIAFAIVTRTECDNASNLHNSIVEKLMNTLTTWHNIPTTFDAAFQVEGYCNGELRLNGGTGRAFDNTSKTWTETINIILRGAIP